MVLTDTWQARGNPGLFLAGQMSGVEGYVESAASGLLAGLGVAALAGGVDPDAPPRTTAIGALAYYVSHADPAHYDPSNVTFGIIEPLPRPPRGKLERKLALANRALSDLGEWCRSSRMMTALPRVAQPMLRRHDEPVADERIRVPELAQPRNLPSGRTI
jgi:methylenetetrahydrofolate--tRNA-(uracil-5-)-methyltransferase